MSEQSPEKILSRYGDFYIPVGEDLISNSLRVYGEWAQREIALLNAFIVPGQTVVDAGAYIGTHSRAFSERVGLNGTVYAFEPNPKSFTILQRNVKAAPLANIQSFNLGLGAQTEYLAIQLDENLHNCASASMTKAHHASVGTVQVQALDDRDVPVIHLLKVDVEGMELQLLLGAERTINRDRPLIFLEVNSLEGSQGFLPWATQHGYMAYGVNVEAFNPDNHAQTVVNIFGSAREVGLLLIHADMVTHFSAILGKFKLPLIDSQDALALLLLHKPQYLRGTLADTDVGKQLGLNFDCDGKKKLRELQDLVDAKSLALSHAAQAYTALRVAFDKKECELRHALDVLQAQVSSQVAPEEKK